jgi:multidrug efflux system outer membrane protein
MTNPVSDMRKAFLRVFVPALLLALSGCMVGPDYKRPAVDVPEEYRDETAAEESPASLADEDWWRVFQDPELTRLIETALEQNYDLQIAAARVLQARAILGITQADQFPTIDASGGVANQRSARLGPTPAFELTDYQVSLVGQWTLDFWGQYRRATEAARARLLASEWAEKEVVSVLVANVAAAYFQLRKLDLQLEISKNTLASREESLDLTNIREERGLSSLLDVRQAEQLVYTASTQIPALERDIARQENLLSTLLGQNPGPIARGLPLTEQPHPPEIPAGLPSALLESRPDIRRAEEELAAANADIGVARAAWFPRISLTGRAGYQSDELSNLFTEPAGIWSAAASLLQPIFEAGRISSGVRLSEAEYQEMMLTYQRTIQGAFRDVSDALVAYRKNREFRVEQEKLVEAARDSARLSELRFGKGETDYLEVLTNETNYFSAQLELTEAYLGELIALVEFYRALGGGWQEDGA